MGSITFMNLDLRQTGQNMNEIYRSLALITAPLGRSIQQHCPNMPNGFGGIQSFGTDIHAVLNAMTTEDAEWIIQLSQPPFCRCVSAVRQKAVGLQ